MEQPENIIPIPVMPGVMQNNRNGQMQEPGMQPDNLVLRPENGMRPEERVPWTENGMRPEDRMLRPENGMRPEERVLRPENGMRPEERMLRPENGMRPEERMLRPENGMRPEDRMLRPENGMRPEDRILRSGDGVENTRMQQNQQEIENSDSEEKKRQQMRLAWLNFLFWNRMYLISTLYGLPDKDAVERQLMQEIEEIISNYTGEYSSSDIRQLRTLLMEQVELYERAIQDLTGGDSNAYEKLLIDWYENGDRIAELLSSENQSYNEKELQELIMAYIEAVKAEMENQINGAYEESVRIFMGAENAALNLADYLTERNIRN